MIIAWTAVPTSVASLRGMRPTNTSGSAVISSSCSSPQRTSPSLFHTSSPVSPPDSLAKKWSERSPHPVSS